MLSAAPKLPYPLRITADGVRFPEHAFQSEKRGNPCAARDGFDPVKAGTWVKHHVTGGQFNGVLAVSIFNHQFAAVVAVRVGQEQRYRQIGRYPLLGLAVTAAYCRKQRVAIIEPRVKLGYLRLAGWP